MVFVTNRHHEILIQSDRRLLRRSRLPDTAWSTWSRLPCVTSKAKNKRTASRWQSRTKHEQSRSVMGHPEDPELGVSRQERRIAFRHAAATDGVPAH